MYYKAQMAQTELLYWWVSNIILDSWISQQLM